MQAWHRGFPSPVPHLFYGECADGEKPAVPGSAPNGWSWREGTALASSSTLFLSDCVCVQRLVASPMIAGAWQALRNSFAQELAAVSQWREDTRKDITDLFGEEVSVLI